MDQATQFVEGNKGILSTVVFLIVIVLILYAVYQYLYPAEDPTYTRVLKGEADARKPIHIRNKVPAIYTGGDFTLSFWIYIDDFNYKAASNKFLFAISPELLATTSRSPLVGVLTPLTNNLMVRANTTQSSTQAPAAANSSTAPAGPDITVEANLQALLSQQTSMSMFTTPIAEQPCDVKDIPLQRWVCVTIVSSGRTLDVYIDGKLARSCVLEGSVHVPRGPLKLRLGENGGFGGRYSSVQMWSSQLTPDAIYGIYMMGPTQAQHNLFTDVASWLNLNVSFTGSAPGEPINVKAPTNPFAAIQSDAQSAYASATSEGSALMSRF
jgi:hypothetical protein